MAQWLGQFSGHTHATRVEDAKASLRHAVAVLRSAGPGPDRSKGLKTVHRLANCLLKARLKLARARIDAARPLTAEASSWRGGEIASMERTYAMVREGGLEAILREFGVEPPPDV